MRHLIVLAFLFICTGASAQETASVKNELKLENVGILATSLKRLPSGQVAISEQYAPSGVTAKTCFTSCIDPHGGGHDDHTWSCPDNKTCRDNCGTKVFDCD